MANVLTDSSRSLNVFKHNLRSKKSNKVQKQESILSHWPFSILVLRPLVV